MSRKNFSPLVIQLVAVGVLVLIFLLSQRINQKVQTESLGQATSTESSVSSSVLSNQSYPTSTYTCVNFPEFNDASSSTGVGPAELEKALEVCNPVFEAGAADFHYFVKSGNLFDKNIQHVVVIYAKKRDSSYRSYDAKLSIYRRDGNTLTKRLEQTIQFPESFHIFLDAQAPAYWTRGDVDGVIGVGDVNGDGINYLEIFTAMSASGSNNSYDLFLYESREDVFHHQGSFTNVGFDKKLGLMVSPGAGPGPEYGAEYYKTENYELVKVATFSNGYDFFLPQTNNDLDKNNNNVLPRIQKIASGTLRSINGDQAALLDGIATSTYFEVVGDNILNYDSNHYTSYSLYAYQTGEDDGSGRGYFIKNFGDINGDGLDEWVVAELISKPNPYDANFPTRYILFHIGSKQGDGTFKFIGGEQVMASTPFDYDVYPDGMWGAFRAQDITGDGVDEIINIPSGCSGNGVCPRRIYMFDKSRTNLILLAKGLDFDSIERVGNDVITHWHDIDFMGKEYYSFTGTSLVFEHAIRLQQHDQYSCDKGYVYKEFDKNNNVTFSEERQGCIWDVKF